MLNSYTNICLPLISALTPVLPTIFFEPASTLLPSKYLACSQLSLYTIPTYYSNLNQGRQ